MANAVIPVEGKGFATFTTKTVALSRQREGEARPEDIRQNYIDRIRSYIPIEVVAFYIFVTSLISDGLGSIQNFSSITVDGYVALTATLFGLLGTVIYSKMTSQELGINAWKLSACLGVIGFLIWIYAMDAKVFEVLAIPVVPSVSGLLLASFTLFLGIIVPTSKVGEQIDVGKIITRKRQMN